MRPWIFALPLICLVNGCNSAPETTNTAQAVNTAEPAATTETAKATPAAETPAETTKVGAPDPAYQVVDKGAGVDPNNLSPKDKAYLQAMEHVKVPPPPKDMKVPDKAKVQFVTSRGTITVELNGKEAPLHTKSFLYLSRIGFFDKTIFHRFADLEGGGKGRIIQGGDPLTKVPTTMGFAGQGGPGYQIPRENNNLKHDAMVLAAARSQDPNSAGSQFYLTLDSTYFLDNPPGYTVFGKVVGGKDVLMKMQKGDTLKKVVVLK